MLFYTYKLHKQDYPLLVKRPVKRDIILKILRTYRIILSFLSRTELRPKVKFVLKNDFIHQFNLLNEIDLSKEIDIGKRNISNENFYKTIAFQIGQLLGLFNGYEFFTKTDIYTEYSGLEQFLKREPHNEHSLYFLNQYKDLIITHTQFNYLDKIKNLREPKWNQKNTI